MKTLGSLVTLLALGAGSAEAQTPAACCSITAIETATGLVSGKVAANNQVFQFKVTNARTLSALRVGQAVFANFTTRQVSLDGRSACCAITSGPTAAAVPALRAALPPPVPANPAQAPALIQVVNRPLKALQVNPNPVAGGNYVQGTVELAQAPGPNGVTVTLESSNPQLAGVPPRVTITHGTTSAETGPIVKATFPIFTQPVQGFTTVIITARAGVQTLQADLRLRRPETKWAALDMPNTCDGNNKGTVKYTLTGPAPSGLKVVSHTSVHSKSGSYGTWGVSDTATVPTGNSSGSMRVGIGRCNDPEGCWINGSAKVEGQSVYIAFPPKSCPQ